MPQFLRFLPRVRRGIFASGFPDVGVCLEIVTGALSWFYRLLMPLPALLRARATSVAGSRPSQHPAPAVTHLCNDGPQCPICLDVMGAKGSSEVSVRYCGHSFHSACLAEWTRRNPRCPVCRAVEPILGGGAPQRRASVPPPLPPQAREETASGSGSEALVTNIRALETVGTPHAWYIERMLRPERTPSAPPPPVAFMLPARHSRDSVVEPAAPYPWYVQRVLRPCGTGADAGTRASDLV